MCKGVIYVLKNPSFPDYVKIGYADNLEQRLSQLNQSECLPFAFRVYCVYEVEERLKDKDVHSLIDSLNPGLRAIETFDGRPRVREFYNMAAEDAYQLLSNIAKISGTTSRLKRMKPEGHEVLDEQLAASIEQQSEEHYTEENHFTQASSAAVDLYKKLKDRILALGDVTVIPKKKYIAFKTTTNICDIQIQKFSVKITLNMKKGTIDNSDGILRDMSEIGHWGNGDYSLDISDDSMLDYAINLIHQSYLDKKTK